MTLILEFYVGEGLRSHEDEKRRRKMKEVDYIAALCANPYQSELFWLFIMIGLHLWYGKSFCVYAVFIG